MKTIIFGVITMAALFTSCLKNADKCSYPTIETTAPTTQINALNGFLQSHGYISTQDPHGFFYNITAAGSGAIVANLCSNITVTYVARLQSGVIFDQTAAGATATFQLGSVIYGWQKGIPYVAAGGSISLYIPPALGYGATDVKDNNGNIVIPANSNLFFDINVVAIN